VAKWKFFSAFINHMSAPFPSPTDWQRSGVALGLFHDTGSRLHCGQH
jgi:hypothetical protein